MPILGVAAAAKPVGLPETRAMIGARIARSVPSVARREQVSTSGKAANALYARLNMNLGARSKKVALDAAA
jgi:hypothetical protein